jgi:hypothetical protein
MYVRQKEDETKLTTYVMSWKILSVLTSGSLLVQPDISSGRDKLSSRVLINNVFICLCGEELLSNCRPLSKTHRIRIS